MIIGFIFIMESATEQPILTLINLDRSIPNLSTKTGSLTVHQIANRLLQSTPTQSPDEIILSILKYIRDSDRWTALASLLLKSAAYHRSLPSRDTLPIVELPRTMYNRPYIPNHDTNTEHPLEKLSVSHQYPYVAMVHSSTPLHMGMDLVVFHSIEISDLQTSFSPFEWSRISTKFEFHLRWAMKEAYVKALGLGMYIEFSSFETRLAGIDEEESTMDIWGEIKRRLDGEQCSVLGEVVRVEFEGRTKQVWDFTFVPIRNNGLNIDASIDGYDACACICRGPLKSEGYYAGGYNVMDDVRPVKIDWIELIDLIRLHGCDIFREEKD